MSTVLAETAIGSISLTMGVVSGKTVVDVAS